MGVQVTGGGVIRKTRRAFLVSGTGATGKAVCYNFDAVDVTAENDTLANASAVNWNDARRAMVEVPSPYNNLHFAGVVDKASNGVIGPNWILIHEPGSICDVHVVASADHRGSVTTKNSGELVNFVIGVASAGAADTENGEFGPGGLAGSGAAMILQVQATASSLAMAELLQGAPTGGVQYFAYVSAALAATVVIHGTVVLSVADTSAQTAGTISVPAGQFVGQRLVINGPVSANSVAVAVSFTSAVVPNLSVEYLASANMVGVTQATLTAIQHFIDAQWSGKQWVVMTNVKIT